MFSISKNKVTLILAIIFVVSVILDVVLFTAWRKEVKGRKAWKDNYITLSDSLQIYQAKDSTWITVVKDYNFRIKDLKANVDSKDALISKLKHEIYLRDVKIKNVQSALFATLNANGSGNTAINDSSIGIGVGMEIEADNIRYALIKDGYLTQSLFIFPDTVTYNYNYQENVSILTTRERKLTKNGRKAFFLIRWLRQWEETTTINSSNPDSKIISATKIKISK